MSLFEDIFELKDLDPDGKKFEKVSRFVMQSENYEMEMVVDINVELYPIQPMKLGQKFSVVLTKTLALDGTPETGEYDPLLGTEERPSLADSYDYVMFGRVYKSEEQKAASPLTTLYVSFGGLLMMLKGSSQTLKDIVMDMRLYFLMRKA